MRFTFARFCALALAFCFLFPSASAAVSVRVEEGYRNDKTEYVVKEYLITDNPAVNSELQQAVDAFDAALSPEIHEQAQKKAKLYNRLDIDVNYFITGRRYVSALIIGRNTHKRRRKSQLFTTRLMDLSTGRRLFLGDLISEDGFAFIAARAAETLEKLFPDEKADAAALSALCEKDALKQADFTMSGMEMTLHYDVSALFPGRMGLCHVRFFYPELQPYFTDEGRAAADNSHAKMVALTFDDGPRGQNTDIALTAIRRGGARVTYFTVGKLYEENNVLLHREYDANHLIANHSWNHWNGHGLKPSDRTRQVNRVQEYLKKELGEECRYFRAPVGTYPPWIESGITLPIIQWSVDTYDFRGKSAPVIKQNIQKHIREGDIVLMHDTGMITPTVLPEIFSWLWANGFMPVTVEELALAQGVAMQPAIVYHRFFNGEYGPRRDSNTN